MGNLSKGLEYEKNSNRHLFCIQKIDTKINHNINETLFKEYLIVSTLYLIKEFVAFLL